MCEYVNEDSILYEDSHLLVIVKPPFIPVQSDNSGDKSMYRYIKEYIKKKYNKLGNVYLGIVHRLDKPVSGVMVFAKNSKSASRLCNAIREHQFEKNYYAVVNGMTEDSDVVTNYLIKRSIGLGYMAKVVFEGTKYAKKAVLSYKTIERLVHKNLSLVEVKLETGRFHQIRVQMAALGHPIYGDKKYGSYIEYDVEIDSLALFAHRLAFKHPTTKETMIFESIPKDIEPWNYFSF